MDLTEEQQTVAEALRDGACFRVVAHAGTGKTTSLLVAARQCPGLRIWFVGYNRKLKLDAQEAAERHGCTNVCCTNFDSVLVKYYDPAAPSYGFDVCLARVVLEDRPALLAMDVDVLVIDEAQDMHRLFYLFTLKLLRDSACRRLILVGDPKQTIYTFRHATSDFLMGGQQLWGAHEPRRTVYLSKTFRFSDQICRAVNEAFRDRFSVAWWGRDVECGVASGAGAAGGGAAPSGSKVSLWVVAEHADVTPIAREYIELLSTCQGETVAMIAYSIKYFNDLLWSVLESAHTLGAPRPRVTVGDDQAPELSTIFTSKGREFHHVYLFASPQWTAELLYVGMTRAKKTLTIVHSGTGLVADLLGDAWCSCSGVETRRCDSPLASYPSYERLRVLTGTRVLESEAAERCIPLLGELRLLGARQRYAPLPTIANDLCSHALALRALAGASAGSDGCAGVLRSTLTWLSARPTSTPAAFFSSHLGRHVVIPRDVELELLALAGSSSDNWSMAQWCSLARCQPELHCGHTKVSTVTSDDLAASEAHYRNFLDFSRDASLRVPGVKHGLCAQSWGLRASEDLFVLRGSRCTLVDLATASEGISSRHLYSLCLFEKLELTASESWSILLLQAGREIDVELSDSVASALLRMATGENGATDRGGALARSGRP
jgi:hypothetical protein